MKEQIYIAVARHADVPAGASLKIDAAGMAILLCNNAGQFFAISERCSHADESLACGRVRNGWISCPAHGARFDLETGAALNSPAKEPIKTFPLRIVGGVIEVAV